ncbi:phosphatidylethanolamine-binding protein [Phlyctochytrium arcticum]|nr:phosphatidylethanolamine-binding protein [Phlyctochytrium arcticum]
MLVARRIKQAASRTVRGHAVLCTTRDYATTAAVDRIFGLAQANLESERSLLRTRIADLGTQGDSAKNEQLAALEVELAYSDPANHAKFADGKADLTSGVFAKMHRRRWRLHSVPKLLKLEEHHKVIGDVLPSRVAPEVQMEINFQNTNWLCPIGQPVPPIWTLYSPEVVITADNDKLRHFTIALIDLDRANAEKGAYEHWCHWLVTDIPVKGRTVIPGGASPYLQPANQAVDKILDGAKFVPSAPETESPIPGKVVFPYVPAHPPASNPRTPHRYFMAVLEQPSESVQIDLETLSQKARKAAEQIELTSKEPTWKRHVEGEGEKRIQVRERSLIMPLAKFMKQHDLELKGHGFFLASWDIHTSAVFSRLGIHEPVYGRLNAQSQAQTVRQLETATNLAAQLPDALARLSPKELRTINYAERPRVVSPRVMTKRGLQVAEMRKKDAAMAEAAANKKKGKKGAAAAPVVSKPPSYNPKTPRLTTLGATAMVKNKEGDAAKGFQGEYMRKIKEQRYRYKNI